MVLLLKFHIYSLSLSLSPSHSLLNSTDQELLDDVIHPNIVTKHGDFLPPLSRALYNIARNGYAMTNEEFESVLRVMRVTPNNVFKHKLSTHAKRERGREEDYERGNCLLIYCF